MKKYNFLLLLPFLIPCFASADTYTNCLNSNGQFGQTADTATTFGFNAGTGEYQIIGSGSGIVQDGNSNTDCITYVQTPELSPVVALDRSTIYFVYPFGFSGIAIYDMSTSNTPYPNYACVMYDGDGHSTSYLADIASSCTLSDGSYLIGFNPLSSLDQYKNIPFYVKDGKFYLDFPADTSTSSTDQPTYYDWLIMNGWILFLLAILSFGFFFQLFRKRGDRSISL